MSRDGGFSRAEIIARLQHTYRQGRPILGAGCSVGIVAKCAERAGADIIIVYSTGRSRIMGLPTTPLGNSNATTLEMYGEIDNVVDDTPIIAGIEAVDPTYLRLPRLLERFRQTGYDGLINFPTLGNYPDRSRQREDVGLGFSREVEMIRLARQQDYFTMAYAFTPDDAHRLAEAGVDVLVAHAGWTTGGLSGATNSALSLEAAAVRVQEILVAGRDANPEIIPLAHGGPFAEPEDTRYLYAHTDAIGFVGASSIERIPIERAVMQVVADFKDVPLAR
ncbi:MAG TPA: phosphoenolpyruvate hydrolase family protein [Chloroflexota bacterium]|nr:phosphoenolpyruvate hydrolase family protein [Chloroflexota bacterium]